MSTQRSSARRVWCALVLAHGGCNSRKSDHIAGPEPLARWAKRIKAAGPDLVDIASANHWRSDRDRTVALARSLYANLPDAAPVWNAPGTVVRADRRALVSLLAEL